MECNIKYKCDYCGRRFDALYENKGDNYYGNRGRYNHRAPVANFKRHVASCKRKNFDVKTINHCNACPIYGFSFENNFCKYDNKNHLLINNAGRKGKIKIPAWCPLKLKEP